MFGNPREWVCNAFKFFMLGKSPTLLFQKRAFWFALVVLNWTGWLLKEVVTNAIHCCYRCVFFSIYGFSVVFLILIIMFNTSVFSTKFCSTWFIYSFRTTLKNRRFWGVVSQLNLLDKSKQPKRSTLMVFFIHKESYSLLLWW